jgi:cytochrome c-type biogenesis protein CcmE
MLDEPTVQACFRLLGAECQSLSASALPSTRDEAMLKSTTLAALGLLTLSGAAYADDDHHRPLAFQPTSPQPIMEVVEAGGGTVTGTIGTVAATWFVLNDGEIEIPVISRGFLPDGIQSGDRITVIGGIWEGAIQADQIIRQDGTAFGHDVFPDRPHRYADND